VSTEWIVLVCFVKYVAIIIIKKEFTYGQSDRQVDDIFEGGNRVPHENGCIRKTNVQKILDITEI